MIISLSQNSIQYARIVFDVLRVFLPALTWQELTGETTQGKILDIKVSQDYVESCFNLQVRTKEPLVSREANEIKRTIRLAVYKLMRDVLGRAGSSWGILTGIRPTKIVHRLWDQGYKAQEIEAILKNNYLVNSEKVKKIIDITTLQRKYLLSPEEAKRQVSVYVCIPFCPTRCHYCSFPAFSIKQWGSQVFDYLDGLKREIKEIGQALTDQGIKVQTVYVGGGTPTSITGSQLANLLEVINIYLRSEATIEFTVEAGRPDTIDEEKLQVLKNFAVDRISINPQTMWEPTLQKIGRAHSVQDVIDKMQLARKVGFKVINMDLIIGLPDEDTDTLKHTLKEIEVLKPENLTLHALAIKRTAKLRENIEQFTSPSEVEKMYAFAEEWSKQRGYKPYYLYRQKQIVANLENVGYSFSVFPCIYNIQMIEERQTIWGLGVGAGSKIVNPHDWTLVNSYNPKDLLLYNQRLDEIIKAKVDKIKGLS